MMNLLQLGFVLTSLLVAQVWSPPPPIPHRPQDLKQDDDHTVVTEGHRVIVVETFDKREVPISSNQDDCHGDMELSDDQHGDTSSGAGELICDSLGRYRNEIASAIGKAKESLFEGAPKEKAKETAHEAKEKVEDVYEKAKERVSDKTHDADGKAREGASQIEDAYEKAKGVIEDAYERAKEGVKGSAKESLSKTKETGKEAAQDVSDKAKGIKESAKMKFSKLLGFAEPLPGWTSSMSVLHLLGFAIAYGMCVWVTFMSNYILAGVLPRHQFGLVQSKIYPFYFNAMAISILLALLGHSAVTRNKLLSSRAEMLQGLNLLASVFLVLVNSQYLEPQATKAMFERFKLEKEEARGRDMAHTESRREEPRQPGSDPAAATNMPASTAAAGDSARPVVENREAVEIRSKLANTSYRLKRLNHYSSMLNLMSLMALTWHLVYIGQCLRSACSAT